jgi:Protein of unknown function (DUF1566)
MKHKLSTIGALVVLTVALVVVTARAQTVANGPYYANPSWDQTLPAATRFIVLSNMNSEAVLDRETGLVWEKSPDTTPYDWQSASVHCLDLTKGGRDGWRLPALPELKSLVDRSNSNPSLPSGHPFTVQSNIFYWSATSIYVNTSAWTVFFGNGQLFEVGRDNTESAWCVRGGPGVDRQ